jgi:hypothetical protein
MKFLGTFIGLVIGLIVGAIAAGAAPRYFFDEGTYLAAPTAVRNAYVAGIADTYDALEREDEGFLHNHAALGYSAVRVAECLARQGGLNSLRTWVDRMAQNHRAIHADGPVADGIPSWFCGTGAPDNPIPEPGSPLDPHTHQ